MEFGLRLTYSIGLVAGVSFLGFGLQPPAADWGLMINENRVGLTIQPWPVVLPVIAVGLLTVGTNLITDGIARSAIGIGRSSATLSRLWSRWPGYASASPAHPSTSSTR